MITTLQGQMSTWTVVKLAFARYMHSRWMTSFFPVHLDYFVDLSSVLNFSTFQMDIDTTFYFCFSSLEREEDLIFL